MSLWKWNDVEFDVDMEDADFLERYEKAFNRLGETEKELQKVGSNSGLVKEYCNMFCRLFDDIFGPDTAEKLFNGKKNVRTIDECYDSFIGFCAAEVRAANKRRSSRFQKFAVKSRK